jgi:hypothetical protein
VSEGAGQRVASGESLEVELGSFEVCMADVSVAGGKFASNPPKRPPAAPRRIEIRPIQTSYAALSWYDPADQARLALVINGRTVETLNPQVLQAGPDRSDERDRDIVQETQTATAALPHQDSASRLLIITRFDRDGIAWHHLGPYELIHVSATAGGRPLTSTVNPCRWHEEAGGWSWVVHEFDVPPQAGVVSLKIDAVHPKTVQITTEAWHAVN